MMPLAPLALPVVEGEPGIFPAPVAQVMRKIGGLFSRKRSAPQESTPPAPEEPKASEPESGSGERDR